MGRLVTDFVTRMYAIISIVHLLLTPNFALLESNEPTEADLECLNDYDKELVCQMKLKNCSEYNLNVSLESLEIHLSGFQHFPPSTCEWKFQVHFFAHLEKFAARLWRGHKILFTKYISTSESIKPKRPINLSVKRTDNGNFIITWNTSYTEKSKTFIESLSPQLKYGVKGSGHYETINVTAGLQKYEIVGRNLKPNSDYVVKARVSTGYNDNTRFSDYSEEYEFRTTSSTQDILKIIIPIVCVILIIFMSTVFYCYFQIKRELWDKLPTPKIASTFKQIHILPLFENDFSLIHVEDSLLNLIENNNGETSVSQTDINSVYHHQQSLKADVDSAPVEHVQVHSSSGGQNKVTVAPVMSKLQTSMSYNALESLPSTRAVVTTDYDGSNAESFSNQFYFALSLLDKSLTTSTKRASKLLSNKVHNSLLSDNTDIRKKSGNNFRNRSYSDSSSTSFFKSSTTSSYQSHENNNVFPDLSINKNPVIPTDLDYSPCHSCSGPSDHNPALTTPCCTESDVPILHVDEGYESFLSLDLNKQSSDLSTKQDQTVVHTSYISQQLHTPSSMSLCGPDLNISPGIQIDCSYQRV